jgi:hypothetical protein
MANVNFSADINESQESKDIPISDRRGLYGCETSMIPHFIDNRFRDGGEVVILKRRQRFLPRKIPGTHFCYRLSQTHGHSAAGRVR